MCLSAISREKRIYILAGASNDEEMRKRALEEMEPLHGRISDALLRRRRREARPGTARATTDDRARSFLKFMDMELRSILAELRAQPQSGCVDDEDWDRQGWLCVLWEVAKDIGRFLGGYERPLAVLLRRAARCCRRTTTAELMDWEEIENIDKRLAFAAQHSLRYKHLMLVGGDGDDTAASASSQAYHRLPYGLKLLSLYMASMLPQGYSIDKHRLIWRWASEGLTAGSWFDWDDLVGKAEECFSELVNREVIIQAANYGRKPAEAEGSHWQVNPWMLQFVNSAAAGDSESSTEILRRLSLHQPDPELPTLLETMDPSHTRSLAASSGAAVDRIPLGKFVYLRVLDLEGWDRLKDEDLQQQICTGKMILLRYLSVRNTGVTRLPPEIKKLRLLEALDVSRTQISELPSQVGELRYLMALDLRSTQVTQLPEQIVHLTDLWGLLVGGDGVNPGETVAEIPERMIVRLTNLNTLATVDLSESSASFVRALGRLRNLQVLAITWSFHQCTDGRYQDALRSSIQEWENLRSLTIHCGLGCSVEFLGSLPDRSRFLEKFKVTTGRFVSVPRWIQGLRYLSFLQITVCKLGTDDLKILAELLSLQCLVLGLDFIPEQAIVIESEWFRQLQTFSVDCPVPWLTFTQGAMPALRYLDLEICSSVPPIQGSVPSGIGNLARLKEVVLRYNKWYSDSSSVKNTVEAVKNAVAEHRNRIDLVVNGTRHGAQAVDEETARTSTEIQSGNETGGEIGSEAQIP